MDYIREALNKAQASLDNAALTPPSPRATAARGAHDNQPAPAVVAATKWQPPKVTLDPKHLERHRIVAASMADPSHVAFNLLRTRVRSAMETHNWKSVAITSPTAGCGKTVISINLAASIARSGELRVVLLDLDLKRPSVANTLGLKPISTISNFLEGRSVAEDCFVEVRSNLIVGLGGGHTRESSELLQSSKATELLGFIQHKMSPDVVIFDLPPMGAGDDTLSVLPRADATLLVAAAGQTTPTEIDACEQQISQHGNFLGVVLNKADTETKEYHY